VGLETSHTQSSFLLSQSIWWEKRKSQVRQNMMDGNGMKNFCKGSLFIFFSIGFMLLV